MTQVLLDGDLFNELKTFWSFNLKAISHASHDIAVLLKVKTYRLARHFPVKDLLTDIKSFVSFALIGFKREFGI